MLGLPGVPPRALVTGAGRGIGRAIAEGLAQAGIDLIVHDHPAAEDLAEVAGNLRSAGASVAAVSADLASQPDCAELVAEALAVQVDILVLNASMELRQDWRSVPVEDMDRQFAVNLKASLLLLQGLVPPMLERRYGRVLSIGSIQEQKPNPDLMVYAALKAAQANIIRSLARKHGGEGVTFNTLAPGAIATERNAAALSDAAFRARVQAQIPAGRLGVAADCAPVAIMLCSEAAGYINGATIPVDGGWSA